MSDPLGPGRVGVISRVNLEPLSGTAGEEGSLCGLTDAEYSAALHSIIAGRLHVSFIL